MASITLTNDDDSCCLFNICRANVWHGAVRDLKRKSFFPSKRMSVLFTDAVGQTEGAIDQGGPQREFFSLVMQDMRSSCLFEGPINKRVLSFNSGGK